MLKFFIIMIKKEKKILVKVIADFTNNKHIGILIASISLICVILMGWENTLGPFV